MADVEQDRREILHVHREWWEANLTIDIPRMVACHASGSSYLMFNTNGHPYFGVDELARLWAHYQGQIEIPFVDTRIVRLDVCGDMAWLACEASTGLRIVTDGGTESSQLEGELGDTAETTLLMRATEIYRRDDGEGNPVWKIWHYNGSPLPPADEPRPAFGDTHAERGVGGNPWGEPLRGVGE
jgi:hypothetical protein